MNEPVEINTLAKIVTGKTPPTNVQEYFGGNYPFITPSDIPTFQEKCLPSTERTLSDKGKKYQKQLLIPKGAVCYVSIGSTIGKLCKTFTESFTNQQIHSLIPYPEKADADYLYYLLRSITPYIQLVGDGKGSGKPIINKTEFSKIKVTVPDVNTQKIVAPILSAYDDLIEVNNQRIKLLEETARELYKEWFVRMRFPGYKKAKFVKGVPEGWEVKELKDFGKVITGKTPSTFVKEFYGGNIPFIKTPDMHGNMFILETEEHISEKGLNSQKSQTLPLGSIIVNCIGALSGAVSITTETSQTNQQIHSIKLNNTKNLEFLFFAISDLKEMIHMYGNTGSTMTNLSKGKFEKLHILYPKGDLISDYNGITFSMFGYFAQTAPSRSHYTAPSF